MKNPLVSNRTLFFAIVIFILFFVHGFKCFKAGRKQALKELQFSLDSAINESGITDSLFNEAYINLRTQVDANNFINHSQIIK